MKKLVKVVLRSVLMIAGVIFLASCDDYSFSSEHSSTKGRKITLMNDKGEVLKVWDGAYNVSTGYGNAICFRTATGEHMVVSGGIKIIEH